MKSPSAVESCVAGVVEDLVNKMNQLVLTAYAENPRMQRTNISQMIAAQDK